MPPILINRHLNVITKMNGVHLRLE